MRIEPILTKQAEEVANAIYQNDGHCCCQFPKTEDTICICKNFRDQIEDPTFQGECECGRYYKYLK